MIDAVADSKDTVLTLLHELHKDFIEELNHSWIVFEGDAKLYDTIKSLWT